ncbi:dipeptidase [Leucobacter sp. UCMA 4100]|uniref:dipeptidase n=1 Tax=Leucobacter sp. UCMA 4100 TaxID=2810534 RepID=UPI0022EAD86C|nr:dipeptidase [Leucobacter sp. UCMA 4100]MDA3147985.1 dipeptidase [Leucobacter sp. UCMA 4100]
MTDDLTQKLSAIVDRDFEQTVSELEALVRIPSVSWPAFDPKHLDESAAAVAEMLRETGVFETVDVRRAREGDTEVWGKPAIVAHRPAKNGKPTVLLYAHHDVQPPGDDEKWDTPPFEPTRKGDRLYARGASDDKAGVISHVAAIRALAETAGDDFDLGIAMFIEGEEEWASKSFGNFLRENKDLLTADAIIVADSDNWDTETPALTVALRGAAAFNVRVETLAHASHSGMFGGAVPDAMMAAMKLFATLWDDEGAVAVEGLTEADLDVPDFSEDELRRDAALLDGVTPVGTGKVLSRIWAKPSISLTGIDAPSIANASNTLVPSVLVRLSGRVAPGQDAAEAAEAIQRHLLANAPFGAHVSFEDTDNGQPFLVDTSGWGAETMRQAMADAWGVEPVDTGIGGSIPFIAELVEEFPGAQILVTGVEDPDTRAHSPNESQHLGVLRNATLTEALFMARLNERTL